MTTTHRWYEKGGVYDFAPINVIVVCLAFVLVFAAIIVGVVDYNHGEVQRNHDCAANGGSYSRGRCSL